MRWLLTLITVTTLPLALLITSCGEKREEPKQHPSEVSDKIFDSVLVFARKGEITSQDEFNAKRNEIAAGYIGSLQQKGLDREELLSYGQILYWGGEKERARRVFEELLTGDDATARNAFRELITMEIEEENFTMAEEMIAGFRKRFPPDPDFTANLFAPCQDLAGRYSEMNKPEEAIRILMEEMNSLPFDAPYNSFYLANELTPLMMEMERITECRELFDEYRTKLEEACAHHIAADANSETLEQEEESTAKEYERHIEMLQVLDARLGMIGTPAPGFTFTHVYNGDSTVTLEYLRGSVTILDFWATWCMPCVIAFSEMRKIHAEYHDRGLAVLGITSLQGMYRDLETGETEGSRNEKLDPEREIELTGSFIEKHRIPWTCALSDRSVFDPEYGIEGIPTFVILDRDGSIRLIQSGIGQVQQKRRMIEKLL